MIWSSFTHVACLIRRRWLVVLVAACVFLSLPEHVWAQWPALAQPLTNHEARRGPGNYFALYKLFLFLPLIWGWIFSTERLGKDAKANGEKLGMPPDVWILVLILPFLIGFLALGLLIPIFIGGWFAALLTWIVPMFIYIGQRNAKTPPEQRLLTSKHIGEWFKSIGKKEKPQASLLPWQMGPPIDIIGAGPSETDNQANVTAARQSPAFVPMKELMADAIRNRAAHILLDFTAEGVAVKYQVDGTWHNGAPRVWEKGPINREIGDPILAVLKKIAGLNPAERRMRQEGKIKVEFEGAKFSGNLAAQGTPTGERATIHVAPNVKKPPGIEELGMRDKMREQLRLLLNQPTGIGVVCAAPAEGLTSTWNAALGVADRLMCDYVGVEDRVKKKETTVENVDMQYYDSSVGEDPVALMKKMTLKQPEAWVVPDISGGPSLDFLAQQSEEENRRSVVSLRAKEAIEAVLRLLALKPADPQAFLKHLKFVLNVRLIRLLCPSCKQAIQADPRMIAQLGLPPGRVQTLFIEKQPLPPGEKPKKGVPEVCPQCRGVGYFGRTGVFELLTITDPIRAAIAANPRLDVLRKVLKEQQHLSLLEEGVVLVAKGATSLAELQRMLRS